MRGGVSVLAARLLFSLLFPVVLSAQTPERTRDLSMATVRYENGLTLGALTMFDAVTLRRARATTSAWGLVSMFSDGRWSLQGALEGVRRSDSLPAPPRFVGLFRSLHSELSLGAASTAQAGFMPTLQLSTRGRLVFDHEGHGARAGGALFRTFDGLGWRTTVMADATVWQQRAGGVVSLTANAMQLAIGDYLGDVQADFQWSNGNTFLGSSAGVRLGEAQRGTVSWVSASVTWPLRDDIWTSVSVGSYPADLIQSLPGGRFFSLTMRLPNGRFPPLRRPPPPPPPVRVMEPLPLTHRLALVIGFPLDSADLREIRVWAPDVETVELVADFVDWIPVPLIRQPDGVWQGYYRVAPGLHRLNLRLDRKKLDVPTNIRGIPDEDFGTVGLVIVR